MSTPPYLRLVPLEEEEEETGGGGAGDQPQGSGRDGRLGVRRAGRLLVAVEEAGEVSGEFRRPGGEFLSGCPERNQRSTRARLRMSAPRSYSPPLDPILREPQLGSLGKYRKGAGGSADQFPFYYRCR